MFHSDEDSELDFGEVGLIKFIRNLLPEVKGFRNATVIPLSGKWALLAEDLRNYRGNKALNIKAEKVRMLLPDDPEVDIIDLLETKSNISKLKERFEWQS